MSTVGFSKDFVWGAASAAYQTEGAFAEDGKGPSIWDTFTHRPDTIFAGDNGDVACDGYHRFEEDIALLASLGIKAYRFSVSWPRVDPLGDGNWNEAGLTYYDRLVDCCLWNGVEPYVTLYHWDLPQALEDSGGWRSRKTAEAFARYAGAMAERLNGRVRNYFTLNEVQCSVQLGYGNGTYAPGLRLPPNELFACHHHQLLAHGLAFRTIQAADPQARISLASTGKLCYPSTESPSDEESARRATFAVSDDDWMFTHTMVLDPVCLGRYPDCTGSVLPPLLHAVPPEDLEIIHTGLDYLALNIYNGTEVRADKAGKPVYVPKAPGCRRTALKWPVTPEVMEFGPRFLWERYNLPVVISENGVSCNDFIYPDGQVHDPDRIDFLAQYLNALQRGTESGVPILGYFHWALTDNFEWKNGYGDRLGLVYVEYSTQRRIPKESADWYASVVRSGEIRIS